MEITAQDALVVMNVQEDSPIAGTSKLVPLINRLITTAKFVVFSRKTAGNHHAELNIPNDAVEITNGFEDPTLLTFLQNNSVTRLILAGVSMEDIFVLGKDARAKEFMVTVVDDACKFENPSLGHHALQYGDMRKYIIKFVNSPEITNLDAA